MADIDNVKEGRSTAGKNAGAGSGRGAEALTINVDVSEIVVDDNLAFGSICAGWNILQQSSGGIDMHPGSGRVVDHGLQNPAENGREVEIQAV